MSDTAVYNNNNNNRRRETSLMMMMPRYSLHSRHNTMQCDLDDSVNEDNDSMDFSSVSVGLDENDFLHSNNAQHTIKASNAFLDFLKPPRCKSYEDDDDDQDNTDPTDSCSCSFYDDDDDEDDYLIVNSNNKNNNNTTTDQDLLGLSVEPYTRAGVTFGTVQVREFACTVGDHPMCRDACPITLDWAYMDVNAGEPYPLDTFECKRFFFRRHSPRRMDAEQRRDRITETSDISEAHLQELERQTTAALTLQEEEQQQQQQQQSVLLETKQQWKIGNPLDYDDEDDEDEKQPHKRQPHPCSREIIDWQ